MKVVFSEQAEGGLESIGDYIAADNPKRAFSFVRELREVALRLGDFPEAFPLVPRYEHYGIRRRSYRDYLIFYRVASDHVAIIHILHGAQDYEAILFPEG